MTNSQPSNSPQLPNDDRFEPLIRRAEIKMSTIVFGVFWGNVLTGLVGAIAFAIGTS